jgi:hypothetical protein
MKLVMSQTSLIILILGFLPQWSYANDGFAASGVGGIVLSKTDSIAIKKEILDISYEKIHVSYDFINESDKNLVVIVMFPLPKYPASPNESGVIAHGQPSSFMIKMNGKPVTYETEVKATSGGKDVTEDLKSVGFTPKQIASFPFDETLYDQHHKLQIPKSQIQTLIEKGLVESGNPESYHFLKWDINVTYFWTQYFPAKSIVHIEHSYKPFIADGADGGYSGQGENIYKVLNEKERRDISAFCPTKQQLQKLDMLLAKKENINPYGQVPGTVVEYILTTANSWKDGIRDFKLKVHTRSKDEIVALCFPAKIHRVSENLYEAQVKKFKPTNELSIFFGNIGDYNWNNSNGYGELPHFK